MTQQEFLSVLQHEVAQAGSQTALAKRLGISQQSLCDVLAARREPGRKLLAALGWERTSDFHPRHEETSTNGR